VALGSILISLFPVEPGDPILAVDVSTGALLKLFMKMIYNYVIWLNIPLIAFSPFLKILKHIFHDDARPVINTDR
jgi:hypothetical protein